MKVRCSLALAEVMFASEERWSKCWLKCWLGAAWRADSGAVWWFDEVAKGLHPTLKRLDALTDLRCFARGLHSTLRRLDALADLRCQECYTWRWNGQMHWRVFGFARKVATDDETIRCTGGLTMMSEKLHPTLKRSNALANFFFFHLLSSWGLQAIDVIMTWVESAGCTSSRSISADWHSIDWSMCCQKNCIHVWMLNSNVECIDETFLLDRLMTMMNWMLLIIFRHLFAFIICKQFFMFTDGTFSPFLIAFELIRSYSHMTIFNKTELDDF